MANSKKGLLASAKINQSHQTATKEAAIVITAAKKEPSVTKIALGKIERIKGKERRLKAIQVNAGYKVAVYGIGTKQELFIYTKDPAVPGILERDLLSR